MSTNPIVAKIIKVLALAEDQKGTSEGEVAARLAARMMRDHAISVADLQGASTDSDPLMESAIDVGRVTWRASLAWALAEHCNCTALRATVTTSTRVVETGDGYRAKRVGSQTASMRLFGHKTDIEVCQYLYDLCERQVEAACKKWKKDRGGASYSEGQAFREAAVTGLNAKLNSIRKAESSGGSDVGTAIMVRRKEEAAVFMRSVVTTIGRYRGGSTGSYDAKNAGFAAGREISLRAGVREDS